MAAPTPTVTRLELEHYALGTLDPARKAAIDAARATDPDLAARLERVSTAVQDAQQGLPAFRIPLEEEATPWWAALWPPKPLHLGALAAAVALVAVVPQLLGPANPADRIVARGNALEVEILHVRAGSATAVGSMVKAQPGDRVQYRFVAPIEGTAAVYNLQDDGTLQAYTTPRPVRAGEAVEGAVQLDDYAGSERIFFLVDASSGGLSVTQVNGAVQRAWDQPLAELDGLPNAAAYQRSLLVLKERP